jgi:hypothetical protein
MHRTADAEDLIKRLPIDCVDVSLPAVIPENRKSAGFNEWDNAAAEAFAASRRASAIFDDAFIHFCVETCSKRRESSASPKLNAARLLNLRKTGRSGRDWRRFIIARAGLMPGNRQATFAVSGTGIGLARLR